MMTHAQHDSPDETYWTRMADASAAGEDPTAPHIASVTCPSAKCDRRGAWYQVPATQVGPLHCGGCFTVLHCDHGPRSTVTTYGGTVGSPLVVETVTCDACHYVVSRTQQPILPGDVPLALLQAVHS